MSLSTCNIVRLNGTQIRMIEEASDRTNDVACSVKQFGLWSPSVAATFNSVMTCNALDIIALEMDTQLIKEGLTQ